MLKITQSSITYDTEKDTYDIKLKAPLSVCWQICTKCNLKCKYCLSSSSSEGEYGLSTEEAVKIINNMGKLGINRLDFTGGEPLIRNDLDILIETSINNNINTIVTTNTLLLDDKNIESLKKASLVQISIDGPENIHDEQRQKEVYKKTIENIKILKDAGCKIRLNSFIYNSNKEYVEDLINLSKDLGVFSHLFIVFTPQGRGSNHLDE
ncbi:MAG: radical SAM protein, partial [Lachnospiraceae bacterium]|nr:radical SAM protein [Lachnospiraceae bacterium]